MALIHKPNSQARDYAGTKPKTEILGRIDGRSYSEHARTPGVQAAIARARTAWKQAHGDDLAAERTTSDGTD
jgi:hypothetical protein